MTTKYMPVSVLVLVALATASSLPPSLSGSATVMSGSFGPDSFWSTTISTTSAASSDTLVVSVYQGYTQYVSVYITTQANADPTSNSIATGGGFVETSGQVHVANAGTYTNLYVWVTGCSSDSTVCCGVTDFELVYYFTSSEMPSSLDITVVETTPDSATLSWEGVRGNSQYVVAWAAFGDVRDFAASFSHSPLSTLDPTRPSSNMMTVTSPQATIKGLTEYSTYYVMVWGLNGNSLPVFYTQRSIMAIFSDAARYPSDARPYDRGHLVVLTFVTLVISTMVVMMISLARHLRGRRPVPFPCAAFGAALFVACLLGGIFGMVLPASRTATDHEVTLCNLLDVWTYQCDCTTDQYGHTSCHTCTDATVAYQPNELEFPVVVVQSNTGGLRVCDFGVCRYKTNDYTNLAFSWGSSATSMVICFIFAGIGLGHCLSGLLASVVGPLSSYSTLDDGTRRGGSGGGWARYSPNLRARDSDAILAAPTMDDDEPPPAYSADAPLPYDLATLSDGVNVFARGRKIVLFGPPGVGKSTLVDMARQQNYAAVDLDEVEKTYEGRKRMAQEYVWSKQWPNGVVVCAADLRVEDIPSSFRTILLLPPKNVYMERVRQRNIYRPHKAGQTESGLYDLFTQSAGRFNAVIRPAYGPQRLLKVIQEA